MIVSIARIPTTVFGVLSVEHNCWIVHAFVKNGGLGLLQESGSEWAFLGAWCLAGECIQV